MEKKEYIKTKCSSHASLGSNEDYTSFTTCNNNNNNIIK